jgi:hypothetical protein
VKSLTIFPVTAAALVLRYQFRVFGKFFVYGTARADELEKTFGFIPTTYT